MDSHQDKQFARMVVGLGLLQREDLQKYWVLHTKTGTPLPKLLLNDKLLNIEQISLVNQHLAASISGSRRVPTTEHNSKPASSVGSAEIQQRTFGRYRIIEEIGRGGMGFVYKAQDHKLGRVVALKVSRNPSEEKNAARFQREAQVMAKLKHPGIINIYDIGHEQGRDFFTMEFISGTDLGSLLVQNPPITKLLEILQQVAQAVHHAHLQGIIHRDLKPSNIMVAKSGQALVLDFGLAKELANHDMLSQSHEIVGTLQYMSPEQVNTDTKEIDAKSDVYALGAILYHILVGHPPFTGDNAINVLYKISVNEPIAPTYLQSQINKDLEAICLKALEKRKRDRYQNASHFAQDLTNYLTGKPVTAKPATWLTRSKKWIGRHRVISILVSTALIVFIAMWGAFIYQLTKERDIAQENETKAVQNAQLAQENLVHAYFSAAKSQMASARLNSKGKDYYRAQTQLKAAIADLQKIKKLNPSPSLQKEVKHFRSLLDTFATYQIGINLAVAHKEKKFPIQHVRTQEISWKYGMLVYPNSNTLKVWNYQQQKYVGEICTLTRVRHASISRDNQYLVIADYSQTL